MHKQNNFFCYILITTFILILFIPMISSNNKQVSEAEKRQLSPFPEWKWEKKTIVNYPNKFEGFFKDHFGFRDILSQAYYLLNIAIASSTSTNVIIGRDDWLFYINPNDGNSLEDFRKNDGLKPDQLKRWKSEIEAKHSWLKKKGINYLFVVAPDKHSIYPEYMPSSIKLVGRQSRLDQFMEYMKDSEVQVLDLRTSLTNSKAYGQLYLKTDTHWNNFGAAVAQYEIIKKISNLYPDIHPIHFSSEDFSWNSSDGGDLANMLNLTSIIKENATPILRNQLQACSPKIIEQNPNNPITSTFSTESSSSGPPVLIFRDSFFTALQPYISQYFPKCVYVWKYADTELMKKYVIAQAPGLVIEEIVERSLTAK